MNNLVAADNLALVVGRQGSVVGDMPWNLVFASRAVTDINLFCRGGGLTFPLYNYGKADFGTKEKSANLDAAILAQIENAVGSVTPEDLFDYIYAVLHSPAYRHRYAAFLKSDFPRLPYPQTRAVFDALAEQGAALRALHLLESPVLDRLVTRYPVAGDHRVDKPRWEGNGETGRVWLNLTQYFDEVPLAAWQFYIGGYQPAQKWLKDRKGRCLSVEDIRHWQRIIVALAATAKHMQEIDGIDFLPR